MRSFEANIGSSAMYHGSKPLWLWTNVVVTVIAGAVTHYRFCCAEEKVIRLLTVVPFSSNQPSDGWTQGLETVPAGLLALKHINETPNFLSGYTLELVVMEGEGCGNSIITKDVSSLFEAGIARGRELSVVGVAGLLCSTAAAAVSKIAGKRGVDLIQISDARSIELQNSDTYPRLYRVGGSARSAADAIAAFMTAAKWKRVSIMHDEQGLYFKSTARLVIDSMRRRSADFDINNVVTLSSEAGAVSRALDASPKGDKIAVVVSTEVEGSALMCAAYRSGRTWPGYVYILLDRSLDDFTGPTEHCDAATMAKAVDGAFTLNARIKADNDSLLVSGHTYEEYWKEYLQKLLDFSKTRSEALDLQGTLYANSVYDEVWAFALALNNSQAELASRNTSLHDYSWGQGKVSDVIERALQSVAFHGASGNISFGETREPPGSFAIHQILSGQTVLVAQYDGKVLVSSASYPFDRLPSDSIDKVYERLPHWLTALVILICLIAISLTTCNAVALISLRKEPDVKASSPYLSSLIFVGCGMIIASVVIYVLTYADVQSSRPYLSALCNAETCCAAVGLNLILTTLSVRLFRIYRLFQPNNFRRSTAIWRDKYLMLGALTLTSVSVVILSVWVFADRQEQMSIEILIRDALPPYLNVRVICQSRYMFLWLCLLYGYDILLMLWIMLMAFKTRHIKRRSFKDTKKVNVLVFALVVMLSLTLSLWGVFRTLGQSLWGHFVFTMGIASIAVTCQMVLYVPKTVPILCRRVKKCAHCSNTEGTSSHTKGSSNFTAAYTQYTNTMEPNHACT